MVKDDDSVKANPDTTKSQKGVNRNNYAQKTRLSEYATDLHTQNQRSKL
jgi:hypothetical protein